MSATEPGVDVVVVGGRIAGSLTAIRLATSGARVRLLEAHTLPSDTLSTHFFRGDGLVRSLAETGVIDEVLATGAPQLVCEYFALDEGPAAVGPAQDPGELGYCLSVRRIALDAILVRRAVELGVDVRFGRRVAGLVREEGRVGGVVDDGGTSHHARVVVGADGRRSTVARLVEAADAEREPGARTMFYRYARDWPQLPDGVGPQFSLVDNEFAYVFPSDAGLACVALSTPADGYAAARRDPAEFFEDRLRAHPSIGPGADVAAWVGGQFTGLPADSYLRAAGGPGWALVGDAGTGQDPWAGHGMDTAARQAEAFASAFVADPGTAESTYSAARDETTLDGYRFATQHAPNLRTMLG
ncbi:NAD(P)/FAD-dependent oxidoreductase [Angustibacter sp. McL0619]|uniref:NAD(P)/FAD-dependent oxidoreductase n=1 Tax=Angustibacter sp. McL0619 TaxID=3415676 RepID=UPI003CE82B9B